MRRTPLSALTVAGPGQRWGHPAGPELPPAPAPRRACTTSPAATALVPFAVITTSRPSASTVLAVPTSEPPAGRVTRTGRPSVTHRCTYAARSPLPSGSPPDARHRPYHDAN